MNCFFFFCTNFVNPDTNGLRNLEVYIIAIPKEVFSFLIIITVLAINRFFFTRILVTTFVFVYFVDRAVLSYYYRTYLRLTRRN